MTGVNAEVEILRMDNYHEVNEGGANQRACDDPAYRQIPLHADDN